MITTEYEIKVLNIDVVTVRKKLLDEGFKELPQQNFRRNVYTLDNVNAWIRLRTDGGKTTLTYKEYVADTIDGVKELETTVGDFSAMHGILEKAGLTSKTYQENRRTRFEKPGAVVEVSIDEWPHVPPYMEIEGGSEDEVRKYLQLLDLSNHEQTSAPTSEVYKRYGLDLDNYMNLTF